MLTILLANAETARRPRGREIEGSTGAGGGITAVTTVISKGVRKREGGPG
jgi:hypothetical protein